MLIVTATDLQRLMICNGSRLMQGFNPLIADDTARDEGNAADWLVQQVYTGKHTAEELVDRKSPNGIYINPDMADNINQYIEGIGCGGAIEYETNFRCPSGRWEVRGRADHVKYDNGVLYVDDLKYGYRIVEVERNWTLIAHAIGFMHNNPDKPVHTIHFTIYQPRPYHSDGKVRRWTITEPELRMLYATLARTLSNPSDELVTNSLCGNCPAAINCPAYRSAQMNAIDVSEMAFNDQLDSQSLAFVYETVERAYAVLDKARDHYKELIMHQLRNGVIMDNYMIEQELANRSLKDYVTPEFVFAVTGKDLTKKTLLSPAQMEKEGVPKEVVATLCERRNKGAKLVRTTADKRARKLFEQLNQ